MIWQGKYKRRQNLTKFDNFSDLFTSFKKFLNPKDATELSVKTDRKNETCYRQILSESKTNQRNKICKIRLSLKTA